MNEANKKNHFSRVELKQRLQQLEAEIQAKEAYAEIPLSSIRKNNWKVCFLALLPVLLATGYFLYTRAYNKKLFSQYYEPYPNVISYTLQNTVEGPTSRTEALQLYEQGHYADALKYFEQASQIGKEHIDLLFYAGIASIEVNQLDKAEAYMQEVVKHPNSSFVSQAEWYLALIHLRKSEPKQAKEHLWLLTQSTDTFKEKASSLLNKL
ncbi:tetratricopeptide repeat protein [Cytophagaceae bacterium DM2B3-1]|uniref:Tetratricopeptide repeat protein n=1 Tax=Xanthocytophaga flava TaxID=3048013 RepID=A0ABT7CCN7_9BACT|nr:tetratricopeptide repeat protein [Xanthocytophaga flavus]MDJ1491447.1 tetratricopeptide repeat protein [Xanthocytophaga flavus]